MLFSREKHACLTFLPNYFFSKYGLFWLPNGKWGSSPKAWVCLHISSHYWWSNRSHTAFLLTSSALSFQTLVIKYLEPVTGGVQYSFSEYADIRILSLIGCNFASVVTEIFPLILLKNDLSYLPHPLTPPKNPANLQPHLLKTLTRVNSWTSLPTVFYSFLTFSYVCECMYIYI